MTRQKWGWNLLMVLIIIWPHTPYKRGKGVKLTKYKGEYGEPLKWGLGRAVDTGEYRTFKNVE